MIAALFVQRGGAYFGLPDIDPWDEQRDARLYQGTAPVLAHPPCARWCRLAGLVQARWGSKIGDDGGCFASALANVRRCGGVLEHPASFIRRRSGKLMSQREASATPASFKVELIRLALLAGRETRGVYE